MPQWKNPSDDPLMGACRFDRREDVAALIVAGADVNRAKKSSGVTPLLVACGMGHTEVVGMLLAAGAAVDQSRNDGVTPLYLACQEGHTATVSALLAAGAAKDLAANAGLHGRPRQGGLLPMYVACQLGHLSVAQQLSSYGANRQVSEHLAAEDVAKHFGHTELHAWLIASRLWSTPLHHLSIISAARARALLRDGADVNAAAVEDGPTPLSLALEMRTHGLVRDSSAAQVLLEAALPTGPPARASGLAQRVSMRQLTSGA